MPAGADLNAPCSGRKLALDSPNLSCLSPVCWLFRLRSVEPRPMQDACLSCHRRHRARSPSARGAFIKPPCPRRACHHFIIPLSNPVPVPPSLLAQLLPTPRPWYPREHHRCAPSPPSSTQRPTHTPAVSPSPSLPQPTQVAQPQPRCLIDPPCVTCQQPGIIRVTATIDLDRTHCPSRKTLIAVLPCLMPGLACYIH